MVNFDKVPFKFDSSWSIKIYKSRLKYLQLNALNKSVLLGLRIFLYKLCIIFVLFANLS